MSGKTHLAKLMARHSSLTSEDLCVLDEVPQVERAFSPGQRLFLEGQVPLSALMVLHGMATGYHDVSDGSRPISSFMISGDLCGTHAFLGQPMDHSVEAVTLVRALALDNSVMVDLLAHHSRIARTLWWMAQRENMQLRGHLTTIGRRNARTGIARLVCELQARYAAVGLWDPACSHLNLTQIRVADCLGLTPVHVGRVLRQFHHDKLIRIERGAIIVLRIAALRSIAEFNVLAVPTGLLKTQDIMAPSKLGKELKVTLAEVVQRRGNIHHDPHVPA